MPRPSKPPRLYLRKRGNAPGWVIRDRDTYIRTGCGPDDSAGAEKALADYIARKYQPKTRETDMQKIVVADIINIYLKEHAPHTRSLDFIIATATPIIEWFGAKRLSDIRAATCREYVSWRIKQNVSDQTARHDLKTLRAAINYYHANYGPLQAVPVVTLPERAPPKNRWLTRSEAARLLLACRRAAKHPGEPNHIEHLKRFILIGLYSGSRRHAILGLRWIASLDSGYIDLDGCVLHRRGAAERETRKRRPPVPIHSRLLPWLRRWREKDMANGVPWVCHWKGQRMHDTRTTWAKARDRASLGRDVTPHTLRHTRVTWSLQAGVPVWEVAGFVGMSPDTVRDVYGHHSPEHMRSASGR